MIRLTHVVPGSVRALLLLCGSVLIGHSAAARAGEGARLPVIFAHGLGITALPYETVIPIQEAFRAMGYDLYVAETPLDGTIAQRAKVLNDEIARLVPTGGYHLVGHSMGGLDARLAVQLYGLGSRCRSVTTLATPHHGSPVADFVISNLDRGGTVINRLLDTVFGRDVNAARNLTTRYLDDSFNISVKNDPRVKYYSMGFYVPGPAMNYILSPWLWLTHQIISDAGMPQNDGMVSVESAQWGEYLGSFPGDHYSETSQLPLGGHTVYREIFGRVAANLDQRFP